MPFIIIASGGQGGSYMISRFNAHRRPDLAFYPRRGISPINIKSSMKPSGKQQATFLRRTFGWHTLNLDKTINENMIEYLEHINVDGTKNTVLAGSLSLMGPFFRVNKIENVFYVIRHPLHMMAILLTLRHKKHTLRYGGINTEACVDDYASLWNAIAVDAIEGNVKIIRHEHAVEDAKDIKDANARRFIGGLFSSQRMHGVVRPEFEQQLKVLTADNYFKIYDKWEI